MSFNSLRQSSSSVDDAENAAAAAAEDVAAVRRKMTLRFSAAWSATRSIEFETTDAYMHYEVAL